MHLIVRILSYLWPWVVLAVVYSQSVHANENLFLHALRNDDTALIDQLIDRQIDVNITDRSGKTALMVAAKAGDSQLVEKLLVRGAKADAKNNNGGSAVMFASIKGDMPTVQLLLDKQVDINATGSNGWGALMIASAKGHAELVSVLLSLGADVNTVDVYDWTPLHRASFENRLQVVQALLDSPEIKINAQDDQSATALHHAAVKGNVAISRLLIEYGADMYRTDQSGKTPFELAQQNGHKSLAALLDEVSSSKTRQ